MKMKLTFLLFAVTVFSLTAQNQTITLLDNASYHVAISISPDGMKFNCVIDNYTNSAGTDHLGLEKTFSVNADFTINSVAEHELAKGNSVSGAGVLIGSEESTSIANNGTSFTYFRNEIDDYDDTQYSLVRNGIVVSSYTNKGIYSLKSNNNNLFMLLGFGTGTSSGPQRELSKINASTNNVEWTITQSGGDLGRKILLNDGNPFMKMQSGNLVEYNSSNGTVVATTTTDDPNDIFQLTTDYIEKLDKSDKKLYTETGTTEWIYRFWGDNVSGKWIKIGDYTYVVFGSFIYVFDESMEDIYKIFIGFYATNDEYILASYIYPNGSVTYITRIGETIYYKHYDFPTVNVPAINSTAVNVVSVHNEQILEGTNWVNSNSFISTVVMNDADLPNVGDDVDLDLVIPPTGYVLTMGSDGVKLNDEGYAEYIFYKSSGDLYIRVKLYFKGTSALGIEDNSISTNIIVSPNPCKNTIKLSNISDINEITVFDNLGQLIFKTKRNNKPNDYLLDITNFKSGLYIIQLKSEKITLNKKIIKL